MSNTRLKKEVHQVWHITASDGKAPVLEILGLWSTPSLPLLPGSLWPVVAVPVKVTSMVQIDHFQAYLYSIELCTKKVEKA